jgi:DNA-binding transcriptional MerR regulator
MRSRDSLRKTRGVRGASPGAPTRSEFARRAGVSRETLRRWELRKLFGPRYALSFSKWMPYYTSEDLSVFAEKKYWRSARGMRIARRALRVRNSRNS